MSNNKIVIAICGPAHSGKSVFLNQLYSILPTEKRYLIRGCPDGEGVWSNGENQHIIQLVREKGKFTPDFVKNVKEVIENIKSNIVLVDVGGIPSRENVEIISHCDYYIILSRDKSKIIEWESFIDSFKSGEIVPVQKLVKKDGENILIEQDVPFDDIVKNEKYREGKAKSPKLLAVFESILDENLKDEFYEEDGILKGRVTNLRREKKTRNDSIIALAEKLIKEIKIDRLNFDDISTVLEENEEILNDFVKKNKIDINLLKEYIKIYMRMFVTNEPKFIYRLQVKDREEKMNIREFVRKKHANRIENRVDKIKQKFLLDVPDKNAVKTNIIDMNKVADFFGMRDENGVIEWKEDKLNEIIFMMSIIMKDKQSIKIYGARPNWLACAIEDIAKENGIENISFYDLTKSGVPLPRENKYQREASTYNKTTESYIASKTLMVDGNGQNSILDYNLIESDESIVLYVTSKKTVLEESDLEKITLPDIPQGKRLYISGRLPLWVTTSIVKSYDNTEKSVHQPNKGFIKFASKDFRTLGDIEKEPKGIYFTKYLEEKDGGSR